MKKKKKMQQVTNYTHANEIDIYLRSTLKYHRPIYCISDFQQELACIQQLPLIKSRAFPRVHVRELFHAFPSENYPLPARGEGQRSNQRRIKLSIYIMIKASSIYSRINWSWFNWLVISVGEQVELDSLRVGYFFGIFTICILYKKNNFEISIVSRFLNDWFQMIS